MERRVLVAILAGMFGVGLALGAGAPAAPGAPSVVAAGVERFVISPGESSVIYRVPETFLEGNQFHIAVGVTHGVQGEILLDRATPRNTRIGAISVDISAFQSDKARRDQAIRDNWLESSKYPTAVFTPTSISGLPQTYSEGQDIPLRIAGDLKVRTVTKPVEFVGSVRLVRDTLTGAADTTIRMTDFGFDPPSILGILRAQNTADLHFAFTARRAP
jgi:polyisoprenoid-binding protein YceI